MKLNKDYMNAMRRGKWLGAQRYRKQIESGIIVGWCLAIAFWMLVVGIVWGLT